MDRKQATELDDLLNCEPVGIREFGRPYLFDYIYLSTAARPIELATAIDFVKRTCAIILHGGDIVFLTKTLVNGQLEHKIIKRFDSDNLAVFFIKDSAENPKIHGGAKAGIVKIHQEGDLVIKKVGIRTIIQRISNEIMYSRIEFEPYINAADYESDNKQRVFNLFTGFRAARRIEEQDITPIKPMLEHIKRIWCRNDQTLYNYTLNWFAHLFQRPAKKIGTKILLKSNQGAGKNIVVEWICDYIIGDKYYTILNDIKDLTGNFNSELRNKVLTVCDEVRLGTDGHFLYNSDKLKNMITQRRQRIELKGKDAILVNDYNNFIFMTNNDNAIKVESSDRRHFILELSNEMVGNRQYFKKLAEVASSPAAAEIFYNYLLRRDITDFIPEDIPETRLKQDLKLNSIEKPILFIIEMLRGEIGLTIDNKLRMHASDFKEHLDRWIDKNGYARKLSLKTIKNDLEKIGIIQRRIKISHLLKVGYDISRADLEQNIRNYLRDQSFSFDINHDDHDDDEDDQNYSEDDSEFSESAPEEEGCSSETAPRISLKTNGIIIAASLPTDKETSDLDNIEDLDFDDIDFDN